MTSGFPSVSDVGWDLLYEIGWLRSNICSDNISGIDEDVDFSGWELPTL